MQVTLKELDANIVLPIKYNGLSSEVIITTNKSFPIYVNKDPDDRDKVIRCIKYYARELLPRLVNYLTYDLKNKYKVSSTFLVGLDNITNLNFNTNTIITKEGIETKLGVTLNSLIYRAGLNRNYGYYYDFDLVNLEDNTFNLKQSNCLIKPVFEDLSNKMYLPKNNYIYSSNSIEFNIKNKNYKVHLDKSNYLEVNEL